LIELFTRDRVSTAHDLGFNFLHRNLVTVILPPDPSAPDQDRCANERQNPRPSTMMSGTLCLFC
jgi:hypothetical protein